MSEQGGGGGEKPPKPDPFAPLPLANLPPVRRRGDTSGPTRFLQPPPAEVPEVPAEAPPVTPEPEAPEATPAAPEAPAMVAWTETPPPPAVEPPLLPVSYSENELRMAVGATPRAETSKKRRAETPRPVDDDDEDDEDRPRKRWNRKAVLVIALTVAVGSGIGALVFLGSRNSAHYYIACEPERVVVEQGRSFPPWGSSQLAGAEWQPLKIPPEAQCHPQETNDQTLLATWYLKILVDHATKLLTAREVTKVDDAEATLKQALLVVRDLKTDDEAKNSRTDIDRLLGDVAYWRASARLKSASEALVDAAKQYDAAALQKPAHFDDASTWAAYTRKIVDELRAGPTAAKSPFLPAAAATPERPTAPPGVALPVEPDQGSGAGSDEPAPVPAPDAGVENSGGVLL